MPRWLPRVLARIHRLAAEGKVQLTEKAYEELRALPLALGTEDVYHIVANLTAGACVGRVPSRATGEWLYVFKPRIAGVVLYAKVVLREHCVVISFHEEPDNDDQDQGEGPEA